MQNDTYKQRTKLDVLLAAAHRLQTNPVTYCVSAMLRNPEYYSK